MWNVKDVKEMNFTIRLKICLKHWWQRNFGYVYLTTTRWNGERLCYRFRARRGRVALVWVASEFVCRLADGGAVVNVHDRQMRGYGKPYPGWTWSYEPTTDNIKDGGAW